MLSNHRQITLDEPTPPPFGGFGQMVNEPILITTTPTRVLNDIQFDHISIGSKTGHATIEDALRSRHSTKPTKPYLDFQ